MNIYVYNADIYCEDCGDAIRDRIRDEGLHPADPDDESTYDSDEFPKGPFPDGGGEADSPQHCGSGEGCLNAFWISQGRKVGAFLENPLTSWGKEYVREAIQKGGEVTILWLEFYEFSQ